MKFRKWKTSTKSLLLGAALTLGIGCQDSSSSQVEANPDATTRSISDSGSLDAGASTVDASIDERRDAVSDATRYAMSDAVTDFKDLAVEEIDSSKPDMDVDQGVLNGAISTARCPLNNPGIELVTDRNLDPSFLRLNMNAINGPTDLNFGCFQVCFDGEELPLSGLRLSIHGENNGLPVIIRKGDDTILPSRTVHPGDTVQPTDGGVVIARGCTEFSIYAQLGRQIHDIDYSISVSMSLPPQGAQGEVLVNNEYVQGPIIALQNFGEIQFYVDYLFGEADLVQEADSGLQNPPITIGRWDITGTNGSYGPIDSIGFACQDADGNRVNVDGSINLARYNAFFEPIGEPVVAILENGEVELNEVTVDPGTRLFLTLLADNISGNNSFEPFRCGIASIQANLRTVVYNWPDNLPWTFENTLWNLVTPRIEGHLDGRGRVECHHITSYPSLWSINHMWDGNTGVINGRNRLPDEAEIVGIECLELSIDPESSSRFNNAVIEVSHAELRGAQNFEVLVVIDEFLPSRATRSFPFELDPNSDETVRVPIQFEEPVFVNTVKFIVKLVEGGEFPPARQPENLYLERPKMEVKLVEMSMIDENGDRVPTSIWSVPANSEDGRTRLIDLSNEDENAPGHMPVLVAFANPYALVEARRLARPVIVNLNDPEVVNEGVLVWDGTVMVPYEGGNLVRLRFEHNTGKVELGGTRVVVQINGQRLIVVSPEQWNARSFEINVPYETAPTMYNGSVAKDGDENRTASNSVRVYIGGHDLDELQGDGVALVLTIVETLTGTSGNTMPVGSEVGPNGILNPVSAQGHTVIFRRD